MEKNNNLGAAGTLWNEYKLTTKNPTANGFKKRLIQTCWRQKMLILELQEKIKES